MITKSTTNNPNLELATGKEEMIHEGAHEGEHRVYTLKDHKYVEDYFKGALLEKEDGDQLEGLFCVYKKVDGSIGLAIHVPGSAQLVARTPGGPEESKYHHYRPQGATVGQFGRIMAEDLKTKEIDAEERGKGITEKLVALAASWCFGIYYCR